MRMSVGVDSPKSQFTVYWRSDDESMGKHERYATTKEGCQRFEAAARSVEMGDCLDTRAAPERKRAPARAKRARSTSRRHQRGRPSNQDDRPTQRGSQEVGSRVLDHALVALTAIATALKRQY